MPTTVTDNTGTARHLWQLPDLSTPTPTDSISYTTLENEMDEGYFSSSLIGLQSGLRSWKVTCPTLTGSSVIAAAITDPLGATVSRAQYVRNLHKWNMTTGLPFVWADPNNTYNQYYLVDFVEPTLTLAETAKGIDIYSTSFTLQQRRINGVTVFDPTKVNSPDARTSLEWLIASNFSTPTWTATQGNNGTATGDVAKVSAVQNGQDIVRIDGSAATGYVSFTQNTVREAFFVMQYRASFFNTNAGVYTGSGAVLLGGSGTNKFQNLSFGSDYQYRLNGVSYAQSNQVGPMNAFGIVHIYYPTGFTLGGTATLGKNTGTKSVRSEVDFGEVLMFPNANSIAVSREITEFLATKWGITI